MKKKERNEPPCPSFSLISVHSSPAHVKLHVSLHVFRRLSIFLVGPEQATQFFSRSYLLTAVTKQTADYGLLLSTCCRAGRVELIKEQISEKLFLILWLPLYATAYQQQNGL